MSGLVACLSQASTLAIDTEADSFHHYREKVCLIQIADETGAAALIDPLLLKDLSPLDTLTADPAIPKIFHSGENDITLLKRDFGLRFASLFDTRIAAQFCGRIEVGLQALIENEFGIIHSKALQRCDWSRRPLSPAQELYASGDVIHLPSLRDRLEVELSLLGRGAWVREECEALAELPPAVHREAPDFSTAKSIRSFTPRERTIFRAIFELREEWARKADLPLFKVLGDDVLSALAVQRPRIPRELGQIRGFPRYFPERRTNDLLEAILKAEKEPETDLPLRPRIQKSPDAQRAEARLKAWRAEAAPQARLDPGLFLPQRLIDKIGAIRPGDLAALAGVPGIRRWRVDAFGPALLHALHARS